MKIEKLGSDGYVVYRGKDDRKTYFSFYVDHDSSCWTSQVWNAQKFRTDNAASNTIVELRRRDRERATRKSRGGTIDFMSERKLVDEVILKFYKHVDQFGVDPKDQTAEARSQNACFDLYYKWLEAQRRPAS